MALCKVVVAKTGHLLLPDFEERFNELRAIAPALTLELAEDMASVLDRIADAEGLVGDPTREIIQVGRQLRWVQLTSAGVEHLIGVADRQAPTIPELLERDIVLTNAKQLFGPGIADHVFAFILAFTHGLKRALVTKWRIEQGAMDSEESYWELVCPESQTHFYHEALDGKTMLVIGMGGMGQAVARRAYGSGMRVVGIDARDMPRPEGVDLLEPPDSLHRLLPDADFVVSCVPLTPETFGLLGAGEFELMKETAYLISVSRGRVVQTDALVRALRGGEIAGAGLDVVDPEPLPNDHPLWMLENVIISSHRSSDDASPERLWTVVRENVRRFAAAEPLVNVVDKKAGY